MREKWKSKYNITTLSSLLILQNNEARSIEPISFPHSFLAKRGAQPLQENLSGDMILRGFAGRWTKRRRRKRGPWRQSKGASFEKARGHRTEPYVAITREKECAESGKVNGDTRKRIRGRRKRRRRRRKRIERQRSNQKGMNIHERAPRLTVIESEKCYREWESRGATLKLSVLIFPVARGYWRRDLEERDPGVLFPPTVFQLSITS